MSLEPLKEVSKRRKGAEERDGELLMTGALYSDDLPPSFVMASSNRAIEPCVRRGRCKGDVGRDSKL